MKLHFMHRKNNERTRWKNLNHQKNVKKSYLMCEKLTNDIQKYWLIFSKQTSKLFVIFNIIKLKIIDRIKKNQLFCKKKTKKSKKILNKNDIKTW